MIMISYLHRVRLLINVISIFPVLIRESLITFLHLQMIHFILFSIDLSYNPWASFQLVLWKLLNLHILLILLIAVVLITLTLALLMNLYHWLQNLYLKSLIVLFCTVIIPLELKSAKVIPLFKSGDHNDFNNYRPISILP